ncbi:hypothetical protein JA1_004400 [Spathaspora sp. JA1]|nr:hypothetical protein JA1_004400 [Spathaspora sp. JA1]
MNVFSTTADIETEQDLIELIKTINSFESISNYDIIEIKNEQQEQGHTATWSIFCVPGLKLNYTGLINSTESLIRAKQAGIKVYRSKLICCSFDLDYFNPGGNI